MAPLSLLLVISLDIDSIAESHDRLVSHRHVNRLSLTLDCGVLSARHVSESIWLIDRSINSLELVL